MNIAREALLAKLPIVYIKDSIERHISPMQEMLPDKRMGRVIEVILLGILGGQTPVITEIARHNGKEDGESMATAKRIYRLLENRRLKTKVLYEGLYRIGQ
jgi:hypothetical protein